MTRDFASNVLPISRNRFAPTRQAQDIQQDSWRFILRAVDNLLSVCVRGKGLPGWSMETPNIVIAFWPRTSEMNEKYGLRLPLAELDTNTSSLVLSSE